jgi:hypothetical protein
MVTRPLRRWPRFRNGPICAPPILPRSTRPAIAVLPVAATEQHGPHLPLSVDVDIVNGVLAAALPHLRPGCRRWACPRSRWA